VALAQLATANLIGAMTMAIMAARLAFLDRIRLTVVSVAERKANTTNYCHCPSRNRHNCCWSAEGPELILYLAHFALRIPPI
jgi:hypothetical protein